MTSSHQGLHFQFYQKWPQKSVGGRVSSHQLAGWQQARTCQNWGSPALILGLRTLLWAHLLRLSEGSGDPKGEAGDRRASALVSGPGLQDWVWPVGFSLAFVPSEASSFSGRSSCRIQGLLLIWGVSRQMHKRQHAADRRFSWPAQQLLFKQQGPHCKQLCSPNSKPTPFKTNGSTPFKPHPSQPSALLFCLDSACWSSDHSLKALVQSQDGCICRGVKCRAECHLLRPFTWFPSVVPYICKKVWLRQ